MTNQMEFLDEKETVREEPCNLHSRVQKMISFYMFTIIHKTDRPIWRVVCEYEIFIACL